MNDLGPISAVEAVPVAASTVRAEKKTINEPAPFQVDELFFSRTDQRGVIFTANEVFQRISGYPWEKVLKAPHRIIRHPDMPRGRFSLMWDYIKAGKPIGAYVKNCAADGRYYWVFAVVTPAEGRYLSVQFKPTSPLLAKVEKEYAALRERERTEELEPEDSANILIDQLSTHGFRDYDHFMSEALAIEVRARDEAMNVEATADTRRFKELSDIGSTLLEEAQKIERPYKANQFVALNMQVRAARLGAAGHSVGVISNNYNQQSSVMKEEMLAFAQGARKLASSVARGSFLSMTARLQSELIKQFPEETDLPLDINRDLEVAFMSAQQAGYQEEAIKQVAAIAEDTADFFKRTEQMKRLASGLEVVRVMGVIECSRIGADGKSLIDVLDDLANLQREVTEILGRIDNTNRALGRLLKTKK